MKLNDIKVNQYNYHSFFNAMTKKHNILVMEHHLHNDIAGLSIKDKHGNTSISYQSTHHKHRQNFTKCHELAHLLLEHEGTIFTFTEDNSPQELEANLFAGFVLAPDIILYGKIGKEKKTLQDLNRELEISFDALQIRLKQFLAYLTTLHDNEINQIILDYQTRKNNNLISAIQLAEQTVIENYKKIVLTPNEKLEYLLEHHAIVTSLQIPELSNPDFLKTLPETLGKGYEWGRDINLRYVWNKTKLDDDIAHKIGKNIWFKEAY